MTCSCCPLYHWSIWSTHLFWYITHIRRSMWRRNFFHTNTRENNSNESNLKVILADIITHTALECCTLKAAQCNTFPCLNGNDKIWFCVTQPGGAIKFKLNLDQVFYQNWPQCDSECHIVAWALSVCLCVYLSQVMCYLNSWSSSWDRFIFHSWLQGWDLQ